MLRVVIDNTFSFKYHLSCVRIQILSRVAWYENYLIVPKTVLRSICLSIVYPLITYGVEACGASGVTELRRLASIQNRSVMFLADLDPISSVYVSKKLLSFNCVYSYFLLIQFIKFNFLGKVISSHLGYLTIYLLVIIILD